MYDEHGINEPALSAELAALERRLSSLAPPPPGVDRDQLMFAAGAASVQSRRLDYLAEPSWLGVRFWQTTTAFATAVSLILAATPAWDGASQTPSQQSTLVAADRVDMSPTPLPPRRWSDRIPSGYLGLRQVTLVRAVGEFAPATSARDLEPIDVEPPATSRQLLQELLNSQERTNS